MKKNAKQTINHSRILVILTAIVSIAAILLSVYTLQRLSGDEKSYDSNISQLFYDSSRTRFCHDNQIVPCDDISIKKWNSEHSLDDRFNL